MMAFNFFISLITMAFVCVAFLPLTRGCTQARLQKCNEMMATSSLTDTSDMNTMCTAINNGFECIRSEMQDCPSSMQTFVDSMNEKIDTIQRLCQDPSSISVTDIANCPYTDYANCVSRASPSGSQSQASTVCLALGEMSDCLDSFQNRCDSEFMNTIMSFQEPLLDMAKDECRKNGFPTDGADSLRQVALLPLLTSALALVWRHFL